MKAHGAPRGGYKRGDQHAVRDEILEAIDPRLDAGGLEQVMRGNSDVLDAAVCALAAAAFPHRCASPCVLADHSSKSYIRFLTEAWDVPVLRRGEGWRSTRRMLLFEFRSDARGIVLQLQLGPGPGEIRRHLFDVAVRHPLLEPPRTLNRRMPSRPRVPC